jgi:hypothetical protein
MSGEKLMSPLTFLGHLCASSVRDLLTRDPTDVPREPGAYILMARPGEAFRYPGGDSPVFYIGQGRRVRRRLRTHRRGILQAKNARTECLYRPVREYGAVFGAYFTFVLAQPGCRPKELEDLLMARFAKQYRSLPVANSAGAWKRMRIIIDGELQKEQAGAADRGCSSGLSE